MTVPRLMSVAFTADAVIERRKTVTRRRGWLMLKPGDLLTLCRKVQGRKPGEPLERLAQVEVVSVRREPLWHLVQTKSMYGRAEVVREGCPGMDPFTFVVQYFIRPQRMRWTDEVTRIEWRYLDATTTSSKHGSEVRP